MDQEFAGRLDGRQKAIGFILLLPLYLFFVPLFVEGGLYFYIKYTHQVFDTYTLNIYLNLFSSLISTILTLILLWLFLKENIKAFFKHFLENVAWSCTIGIASVYIVSIATSLLISSILGTSDTAANQNLFESLLNQNYMIMAIQAVVLAPVVEELLFRGLIFRSLRGKGKYLAHIISGLAFGFIHIYQGLLAGDMTQLLYLISYGGMGLVFSWAYEKKKTICVPIIMHMLNNLVAVILITKI